MGGSLTLGLAVLAITWSGEIHDEISSYIEAEDWYNIFVMLSPVMCLYAVVLLICFVNQLATTHVGVWVLNIAMCLAYNFMVSFAAVMISSHVPYVLLYTWGACHVLTGALHVYRMKQVNSVILTCATFVLALCVALTVATIYEAVEDVEKTVPEWFSDTWAAPEVVVGVFGWYVFRL